jgi:homoserine dehydrogenase
VTPRLSLLQIGKGTIGAALIDQVAAQRPALRQRLGVDLVYAGIAGRAGAAFAPDGIDLDSWRDTVGRAAGPGPGAGAMLREAAARLRGPVAVIDATADAGMTEIYVQALQAGFSVVACNKKPLAGPLAGYRRIMEAARGARRRVLYEVTVGAGLPTLGTLRDLVETGDRVRSVEGCFSGTLNFLCAGLDRGEPFSAVLARARGLGYTEPDPRDDLRGEDVARKALILAREAGLMLEPDEVRLGPFCEVPARGDAASFMKEAASLDAGLRGRWEKAAQGGRRMRYVATVGEGCDAALREVPADGPLGRLAGPENIFAFRTERYHDHPLLVAGPGAGPAVTAAGAFGDILKLARAAAMGGGGAGE